MSLISADVSCLMRLLHGKDEGGGGGGGGEESHRGDLVTRDLLGGCGGVASAAVGDKKEVDLGPALPSAWERRLDINAMSGKVYSEQRVDVGGGGRPLQDLNMPPLCSFDFTPPPRSAAPHLHKPPPEHCTSALDLKLLSPAAAAAAPHAGYQSVCTLEKVKSALERAQHESQRKPQPPACSASPASSSTTTSSTKRRREAGKDEEAEGESRSSSSSSSVVVQGGEDCGGGARGSEAGAAAMALAGCPGCLLYVMVTRSDPRCPRCNSAVPLPPLPRKKPRIDLNAAATESAAPTNSLRTLNFF